MKYKIIVNKENGNVLLADEGGWLPAVFDSKKTAKKFLKICKLKSYNVYNSCYNLQIPANALNYGIITRQFLKRKFRSNLLKKKEIGNFLKNC